MITYLCYIIIITRTSHYESFAVGGAGCNDNAPRPNPQNQPALEKDRYRIRKAFVPGPAPDGAPQKLIVADYGQLEVPLYASTFSRTVWRL